MRKRSILDLLIVTVLLVYVTAFFKIELKIGIPVNSYAYSDGYLWYCLPNKEGVQPEHMEKASYLKEFISNNDVYYAGDPEEKIIYLTFDDCPSNGNIPHILDTLEKHNATAAFFMTELYIREHPEVIRRIADSGSLVCNHTSHHIRVDGIGYEKLKTELIGVEDAYRDAAGKELPRYFRPPQGGFTQSSLENTKKLGYKTIFWSFEYADWEINSQPSEEKAFQTIIKATHPGEIALLHSQSKTNVKVLDRVLSEWEMQGYIFKSLDDLPGNEKLT